MKSLMIVVAFCMFYVTTAQESDSVIRLPASEFKTAVENEDVQLVDVRTSEEFKQGSIKHAINIDFFLKNAFYKDINTLDKKQPIYIYCRSGNRSLQASKILDSLGFDKIYDLNGGYMNWPYKE